MAQLLKITGIIAFLTILPGRTLASVTLSGIYRGEIGQLDLQTRQDGRVTGRYTGGGACAFDPQRPVLDGEFEGKVLVATVSLCQTGPGCEERPYNILAFYDSSSGALVADLQLDPGCTSPALEETRFVLRPAAPEEVQPPRPAIQLSNRKSKRLEECRRALERASQLFQRRDYAGASFYFEQGLTCDKQNWAAHLGLGISELRRGNAALAVASIERARELAHAANQDDRDVKDIYYNLACAHARQNDRKSALENLRRAVELGFADPEYMEKDADLQILRDDREYKAIQDLVWEQRENQRKANASGKGDPL